MTTLNPKERQALILEHLFKYALNTDVITMISEDRYMLKAEEDTSSAEALIPREEKENEHFSKATFLRRSDLQEAVRARCSVVQVIDLIDETLNAHIIEDVTSSGESFASYQMNYSRLCGRDKDAPLGDQEGVFVFSFAGDSRKYNLTFVRDRNDIRKGVEYGSRTSSFVDRLIKHVIETYNILVVKKVELPKDTLRAFRLHADAATVEVIPSQTDVTGKSDNETLRTQIKILVRYRDKEENKTYTETAIDDISVSLDKQDDGTWTHNFEEHTFLPGVDVPDYHELTVKEEDKEVILEIRNLLKGETFKYEIFDQLRERENSNLGRIVNRRVVDYRNARIAAEKAGKPIAEEPRVEFSLTPLSIYCNRIASRHVVFALRHPYQPLRCQYEFDYDPLENPDPSKVSFKTASGKAITEEDPLVIMITEHANGRITRVEPGVRSDACNLYDENPRYYGKKRCGDKYKGLWFSRTMIKDYTFRDRGETLPFLAGDIQEDNFKRTETYPIQDMIKYQSNRTIPNTANGKEQMLWYHANKHYRYTCPNCNTEWLCENEEKAGEYSVYDFTAEKLRGCCPACVMPKERDVSLSAQPRREVFFHQDGAANEPRYFADDDLLSHTDYCVDCMNSDRYNLPKAGLLRRDRKSAAYCAVCGGALCTAHSGGGSTIKTGKKDCPVCTICNGRGATGENFRVFNLKESKKDKIIWKQVVSHLKIGDRKSKRCQCMAHNHRLWIRITGKKHVRTYFFLSDKDMDDTTKFKLFFCYVSEISISSR